MIRQTEFPPTAAPQAKIAALLAGLIAAGALTVFALGQTQETPSPRIAQAPTAPVASPGQTYGGLRSASYYPEQLAALQSLNSFHPTADQGQKPRPAVLAAPARPSPFEPKPIRHADAPRSIVAIAPPTPAAVVAAPEDKTVKLFGVPVPGAAQIGDRVGAARDTAGHWGAAVAGFGQKLVTLWR